MALNEQKLMIDGINVNYVRSSRTGRKNILCVPGALGTWKDDFGQLIEWFDPAEYTVVVFDPPGYGKTRPPCRKYDGTHNKRDARVGAKLMEALGLTPFSVLSWSEGARTGLHMAHEYPDLVENLVEWGGVVSISEEKRDFFHMWPTIDSWSPKKREKFMKIYGRKYLEETWEDMRQYYFRIYDHSFGNICREILPEIKCPVLVIDMENDSNRATMRKESKYIANNVQNGKHIFHESAAHDIHLTHGRWFSETVQGFLRDNENQLVFYSI